MKFKGKSILILLNMITILALIVISTPIFAASIVGQWDINDGNYNKIVFYEEGYYFIDTESGNISGTWELLSDGVIRLQADKEIDSDYTGIFEYDYSDNTEELTIDFGKNEITGVYYHDLKKEAEEEAKHWILKKWWEYSYDEDGKLTSEKEYGIFGSKYEEITRNFEYEDGVIVNEVYDYVTEEINTQKKETLHHIDCPYNRYKDGISYGYKDAYYSYQYFYDENGLLDHVNKTTLIDPTWCYKESYIYDEHENIIEKHEEFNKTKTEKTWTYENTYNESFQIVESIEMCDNGDISKYKYTYNDDGQLELKEKYNFVL